VASHYFSILAFFLHFSACGGTAYGECKAFTVHTPAKVPPPFKEWRYPSGFPPSAYVARLYLFSNTSVAAFGKQSSCQWVELVIKCSYINFVEGEMRFDSYN
jgi:hypothetical protein